MCDAKAILKDQDLSMCVFFPNQLYEPVKRWYKFHYAFANYVMFFLFNIL